MSFPRRLSLVFPTQRESKGATTYPSPMAVALSFPRRRESRGLFLVSNKIIPDDAWAMDSRIHGNDKLQLEGKGLRLGSREW